MEQQRFWSVTVARERLGFFVSISTP